MKRNPSGKPRLAIGVREKAAERRLQAFELRKQGATYRAIGRALQCGERTAWRDVMGRLQELAKLEEPAREGVKRLELERLDMLLVGHMPRAAAGDDKSARIVLQVVELRARLHGLLSDHGMPLGADQPRPVTPLIWIFEGMPTPPELPPPPVIDITPVPTNGKPAREGVPTT